MRKIPPTRRPISSKGPRLTAEITIPGTLVGGLFITFLGNGLTLLGLGAPFRYGLNGAFILLAMAIGALKRN